MYWLPRTKKYIPSTFIGSKMPAYHRSCYSQLPALSVHEDLAYFHSPFHVSIFIKMQLKSHMLKLVLKEGLPYKNSLIKAGTQRFLTCNHKSRTAGCERLRLLQCSDYISLDFQVFRISQPLDK